jgi:hypothetical protein
MSAGNQCCSSCSTTDAPHVCTLLPARSLSPAEMDTFLRGVTLPNHSRFTAARAATVATGPSPSRPFESIKPLLNEAHAIAVGRIESRKSRKK